MSISVIIVDDEPLARRRIRSLLSREPGVVVAEECGNAVDAIAAIRKHGPDLVFLDVQMPGMTGFDIVRSLRDELECAVVFVTAFEEFSLRAFDVEALDYLVKPFHRARFQETMRRFRHRLADARELEQSRAAGKATPANETDVRPRPLDRIAVKTASKVTIVRTAQIDWIEGDGNYVRIHAGRAVHLLRQTMKSLADQLNPDLFVRIHHSSIVNAERVVELRAWTHGDYIVVLQDGKQLTSSRSYSANLRRTFAL